MTPERILSACVPEQILGYKRNANIKVYDSMELGASVGLVEDLGFHRRKTITCYLYPHDLVNPTLENAEDWLRSSMHDIEGLTGVSLFESGYRNIAQWYQLGTPILASEKVLTEDERQKNKNQNTYRIMVLVAWVGDYIFKIRYTDDVGGGAEEDIKAVTDLSASLIDSIRSYLGEMSDHKALLDWFWLDFRRIISTRRARIAHADDEGICQCSTERLISESVNPKRMRTVLAATTFLDQFFHEYDFARKIPPDFHFPKLYSHGGITVNHASPSWLCLGRHDFDRDLFWADLKKVSDILIKGIKKSNPGFYEEAFKTLYKSFESEVNKEFGEECRVQFINAMKEAWLWERLVKNADLIDGKTGLFSVLGLLTIYLKGPYRWQANDIQGDGYIGASFSLYNEEKTEIGYIQLADASNDPEEPDINQVNESNFNDVDRLLRELLDKVIDIKEWMSPSLVEVGGKKSLMTTYITKRDEKDWQNIVLRMSINTKKIVVAGVFDIAHKDEAASIIFHSMHSVRAFQ